MSDEGLIEAVKETNRWLYEMNGVVIRLDERLAMFIERVDDRASGHSERIEDMASKLEAVERNMMIVRWWSAGAACVVTTMLALVTWLVSTVPAQAWTKVLGG